MAATAASTKLTTALLPQRLFETVFRVRWKFRVRYVADLFGKFAGDRAHVFELFRVPLAERAHEVMDPQLYPHHQRELSIHPER